MLIIKTFCPVIHFYTDGLMPRPTPRIRAQLLSLMIKLFPPVHLITPVKDRANTHCVQELQLQQSVAEDVMCMQ